MRLKWRNYGLWVALGSLVALVLNDVFGITADQTNVYVDTILVVLVAAGVISNPSLGNGFIDDNNNGIDDREEGAKK
jgi:uncharacterized membrane protein